MDYNLFPVFVEIMRHRNISKAAAALGITQPAASNALSRLRHQFGDQLFLRASHGVIPTQYATEISAEIEHHVEQLKLLTHQQSKRDVDLSQIKRRFKIITYDMEECIIMPTLIGRLASIAPNLELELRPYNRKTFKEELITNQADIVMNYMQDVHKNLISRDLLYQDFACIARAGHPELKKRLTVKKYSDLDHMIISPEKGGFRGWVDEKLEAMGHRRHVKVSVPHFLTGCQIVANTNYLLTLPRLVAEHARKAFDVSVFELPFEMKGFSTGIHWHRRLDSDPEHKAIREVIMKEVKSLEG